MKILKKKIVFRGDFLNVIRKEIVTDEGKKGIWESVSRKDASFMFALTKKKEVILEKIYKYPSERFTLTIPAGMLDKNESPAACAKRELLEETGYKIKKLIPVFKFLMNPGLSAAKGFFFFAPDVEYTGERKLDDLEVMEIIKVPLKKLPKFLFDSSKKMMVDLKIFGILEILKEKKLI